MSFLIANQYYNPALLRVAVIVAAFATFLLPGIGTAQNYRLGVGDQLLIEVFGEDDLTLSVLINESGEINYPFVGDIQVVGKTSDQIADLIDRGLRGDYLINPEVRVTVAAYRAIFVTGEVKRPGSYAYQPGLTVFKAVTLTGGFSERAARNKLYLVREGQSQDRRIRVNPDDVVNPGDTVIVAESFF